MNRTFLKLKLTLLLAAVAGMAIATLWVVRSCRQTTVGLAVDEGINITPQQITSIKAIGEWEFLSIANEELVDTVRRGIFSDDHLARIYYATVRLGINLHQVEPGWIVADGDTLRVTLPDVGLLDRDFIDEARTKSFFERGSWSHHDRELLYQKAYRQTLRHCLTPGNLRLARDNGESQLRRMLKAMGYDRVSIRFAKVAAADGE